MIHTIIPGVCISAPTAVSYIINTGMPGDGKHDAFDTINRKFDNTFDTISNTNCYISVPHITCIYGFVGEIRNQPTYIHNNTLYPQASSKIEN